jgi:hypothetical protein
MSLKDLAEQMKTRGRNGDTELIHMTKGEVAGLQQLAEAAGGTLTINPDTGLPEASFLKQMLPTILGAGAMFIPGMQPVGAAMLGAGAGMLSNKNDPLMGALTGGLGAFGGASLAGGLGVGAAGAAGGAAGGAGLTSAGAAAPSAVGTTLPGASTSVLPSTGYSIAPSATTQGLSMSSAAPMNAGIASLQAPAGALTPGATTGAAMGGMDALKYGSMALAPGIMYQPNLGPSGMPGEGEDTEDVSGRYEYRANPTGGIRPAGAPRTSEAQYFEPEFRRRMAQGGAVKKSGDGRAAGAPSSFYYMSREMQNNEGFAQGGITDLANGGFILAADIPSAVGEGNTEAGYREIAAVLPGAMPIRGKDKGQADTVKTSIDGKQPARVAHGEMYVPPEALEKLAKDPKATKEQRRAQGAKKLYAMMDKVRKQATGNKNQIKPVNLKKALA